MSTKEELVNVLKDMYQKIEDGALSDEEQDIIDSLSIWVSGFKTGKKRAEKLQEELDRRGRGECICIKCGLRQSGVLPPGDPSF